MAQHLQSKDERAIWGIKCPNVNDSAHSLFSAFQGKRRSDWECILAVFLR